MSIMKFRSESNPSQPPLKLRGGGLFLENGMTINADKLPNHVAIVMDHTKLFRLALLAHSHSENLGGQELVFKE